MRDEGVTAVLGTVLMLAVLATLIPGAMLLRAAISEEMDAQRAAAERAAWCARHPGVGPPTCELREPPMVGYDCAEVEADVWLCARPASLPVEVAPTVAKPPLP